MFIPVKAEIKSPLPSSVQNVSSLLVSAGKRKGLNSLPQWQGWLERNTLLYQVYSHLCYVAFPQTNPKEVTDVLFFAFLLQMEKKNIWGSQSFSVSCLNSHHESREGLALNAGFFPLSLTQVGKIWSPPRPSYWTLNTSGDFSFLVCKDNIHMCSWYPALPVQGRPEDLRTLSLLRWTLQILWGWITSKVFGFNLEISAFQATCRHHPWQSSPPNSCGSCSTPHSAFLTCVIFQPSLCKDGSTFDAAVVHQYHK